MIRHYVIHQMNWSAFFIYSAKSCDQHFSFILPSLVISIFHLFCQVLRSAFFIYSAKSCDQHFSFILPSLAISIFHLFCQVLRSAFFHLFCQVLRSAFFIYSAKSCDQHFSFILPSLVSRDPFWKKLQIWTPFIHSNLISCSLIGSLVNMQSVLKMSTALRILHPDCVRCFW